MDNLLTYDNSDRITHILTHQIDKIKTIHDINVYMMGEKVAIYLINGEEFIYNPTPPNKGYDIKSAILKVKEQIFNDSGETLKYTLDNGIDIVIDGEHIKYGYRCSTTIGRTVDLTLKEIDELKNVKLIIDDGFRQLMYLQQFTILNNEVLTQKFVQEEGKGYGWLETVPYQLKQRDIENLEFLGIDTTKFTNQTNEQN